MQVIKIEDVKVHSFGADGRVDHEVKDVRPCDLEGKGDHYHIELYSYPDIEREYHVSLNTEGAITEKRMQERYIEIFVQV